MKRFNDLSEQEVLALAISLEEDDERNYADVAAKLRKEFPASARIFEQMQEEESGHRRKLTELYRSKFGDHIPHIRRQDIIGLIQRKPVWLMNKFSMESVRRQAIAMEAQNRRFYEKAAQRSQDADVRALLDDLALEERRHQENAEGLGQQLKEEAHAQKGETADSQRLFLMQIVQPGLAGLMDGSVSTLAPVFAAATVSHSTHTALVVGLAASIGAGISMGFAEALSDDGVLTGRGHPLIRGVSCGMMTAIGGIGHTLPFLIGSFQVAMAIALIVVVVELAVITWVRNHYMETPIGPAALQVAVGGALVFATGILIGGS